MSLCEPIVAICLPSSAVACVCLQELCCGHSMLLDPHQSSTSPHSMITCCPHPMALWASLRSAAPPRTQGVEGVKVRPKIRGTTLDIGRTKGRPQGTRVHCLGRGPQLPLSTLLEARAMPTALSMMMIRSISKATSIQTVRGGDQVLGRPLSDLAGVVAM